MTAIAEKNYRSGAAEVTNDLRALTRTASARASFARLTGAQKWLRDPCSLNASVERCRPAAASRRIFSVRSGGATTPIESTIYYVLSGDPGLTVAGTWRAQRFLLTFDMNVATLLI
jgi:hypothetical protein